MYIHLDLSLIGTGTVSLPSKVVKMPFKLIGSFQGFHMGLLFTIMPSDVQLINNVL